jgi:ribosomal protein S18 acetylase RimI-like enzyme
MADWVISRLEKTHDRSAFSSGKAPLDAYLQSLASQYEKRRLGRTYVATEPSSTRIAGYYTLAAGAIDVSALPESARKKLPKHPVPSIHLGRLAVDQAYRGRRLGETLLFHALQSALELSEKLGAFSVDVWAIDETAAEFYRKYGFIVLEDDPLHLYLPMKSIATLFGA